MVPGKFLELIDDAALNNGDGIVVWLANGLSIVGTYIKFDHNKGFLTISQKPGPEYKVEWRAARIDVESIIAVTTPWREIQDDHQPVSN